MSDNYPPNLSEYDIENQYADNDEIAEETPFFDEDDDSGEDFQEEDEFGEIIG